MENAMALSRLATSPEVDSKPDPLRNLFSGRRKGRSIFTVRFMILFAECMKLKLASHRHDLCKSDRHIGELIDGIYGISPRWSPRGPRTCLPIAVP